MKKRLLAFLLAVSIAVSMLVMPASAAGNNTAVQFAITLGAMDSEQSGALDAAVTRGAFARMLTSYSTYRESVSSQGAVGTLYTDLPGSSAWAPYVRIAVQQGWMNGYTDGSFRPNNAVTLEEACTAVLKLMGYKMTASPRCLPRPALPLPLRWQARPTRWAARPLLPRCPPSTAAVSARWSLCCWA